MASGARDACACAALALAGGWQGLPGFAMVPEIYPTPQHTRYQGKRPRQADSGVSRVHQIGPMVS